MAWREKIGLVSLIVIVMGLVGFLTFGFTQAVCPTPPLNIHGTEINNGYLVIHGNAYMLADWNSHPTIEGTQNVLYPPVNGGGMDASFLFPTAVDTSACAQVLTRKSAASGPTASIYMPCQLFSPNSTQAPSSSQYSNTTSCHLSSTALNELNDFQANGVPQSSGGNPNKVGRVYYQWEDLNTTNNYMAYNGAVLNLNLLQSLPTSVFDLLPGGLIEAILANATEFAGKDMTVAIQGYHVEGNQWQKEAECLDALVKVGSIDTLELGCIASDVVLYVSLVVILAVIFIKFCMAVFFGWFLSYKLGSFGDEDNSYAARMKREEEIENWTRNMQAAPSHQLPNITPGNKANKRKTLLPQTSRFTQPEHGVHRFDNSSALALGTPSTTNVNAAAAATNPSWQFAAPTAPWASQTSFRNSVSTLPTGFGANSPRPHSMMMSPYGRGSMSSPRPSSMTLSVSSLDSGNTHGLKCPLPLSPHVIPRPAADFMPFKFVLAPTVCLVTCYSEGEEGIRTTLDSIALSDYPNSHKLLLVICDGIIKGHGNDRTTPEICVDMMRDLLVPADQVEAHPYVAIADGKKRTNYAKVYAGFYKYNDDTVDPSLQTRVPMITLVKCGSPEEQNDAKPGNRGKRDSQIVFMQFLQKVMFDERMTRMEYDFFNAIWRVSGLPADAFELCLMVDADTKLFPDALTRLVAAAVKDPSISGLCGETKIANKKDSWVTMMQVFEYYISHHQTKAFESVFGGVTCLPGCFCMYRIKAPKGPNGYWVPIMANPDIVERYSENVVDTLHKKNLLLLGEDRYLSTLMLKTFPHRKMMFVPQAVCKTVVPDTFMVLLSQRRRWINSTIHNLMELLFVNNLCGTFCFSMQFVVFMDLVGTLALPAAISFTLYLIIMALLGKPSVISLILLALILGLPAVLIVMTSRKIVYVAWMLVYLISLPIWNFVLPMYAYWHFDDFSWGDTRKVEGDEKKHENHGDKDGEFDSSAFVMKRWHEFERERRVKYAQEHGLPTPTFMDPNPRGSAFRDSMFMMHHSRQSSMHSSDLDYPLTQHAVAPAGLLLQNRLDNYMTHGPANMPNRQNSRNAASPSPTNSNTSESSSSSGSQRVGYQLHDDPMPIEEVPLDEIKH
ncbi:chitin synthase-domain-containing protein [Gongronella butleri]|nr:chitin synthase-domain-containing protein [Gongronella butleri]